MMLGHRLDIGHRRGSGSHGKAAMASAENRRIIIASHQAERHQSNKRQRQPYLHQQHGKHGQGQIHQLQ